MQPSAVETGVCLTPKKKNISLKLFQNEKLTYPEILTGSNRSLGFLGAALGDTTQSQQGGSGGCDPKTSHSSETRAPLWTVYCQISLLKGLLTYGLFA